MTTSIALLQNVAGFHGLLDRVLNRSIGLPGMATFYGPSGWGKTSAVIHAANAYNAYWVQVKDCWTPTYLTGAILRELGLPPKRGVAAMVDAIGGHLARTDRPLIIDDAQYLLRKRMIELTRDIHESSQAPVILVGEEKLPQDLTGWENIHNRMLAWEAAQPCNMEDAELLAEIYCPSVTVERDLLAQLVEASNGSTRRVATNLDLVKELALRSGTRAATLELWGGRSFHTGQPPAVRAPDQLRPGGRVVSVTRKTRSA